MSPDHQLLEKLRAAKYSGVARVRHENKDLTYRSMAELDRAIASLERRLGQSGPARVTPYTSKGLT